MGSLQFIASANTNSGSSTSTITFSNISQSYTDLIIFYSIRLADNQGETVTYMRLNGSTSNSQQFAQGSGVSVITATQTGLSNGLEFYVPSGQANSGHFSNSFFYIQNYKSNNVKITIGQSNATRTNSTNRTTNEITGRTAGTLSATTTIDLTPTFAFERYCTFYLYGIEWTP